ncbi:Fucolectin-1, partial [Bulinus truncatus]
MKNTKAILTTKPEQDIPTWLTDENDGTCNADQNLQELNISWSEDYPFTWLRVKVANVSANLGITLTFIPVPFWRRNITCNPLITVLDDTTVDYRCNVSSLIRTIVITGSGLKSLCSVYVSGGRNVALKQSATQSSKWPPNFDAYLAVDGNTNNNFDSGSCTHTLHTDRNPSWTLILDSIRTVNRIILYNRGDCCKVRLQNFKLAMFDDDNDNIWSYQDARGTLDVYTIYKWQESIMSKIRISPTSKEVWDTSFYLTLCEVEVYGECVAGSWGLECNKTCPSDCPLWCHQETGQCLSCLGYNDPPVCERDCSKGFYGYNCSIECPPNCKDAACNKTGYCISCQVGYVGHFCDQ